MPCDGAHGTMGGTYFLHIFNKIATFVGEMKYMKLLSRLAVWLVCAGVGATAARAQVPFDRGMKESVTFLEKGQWITGISVSYSANKEDNYQFFILEGLNGDGYGFKISPMVLYAYKDNQAAGGRFNYSRSMQKLESGSVIIDSETTYDVDNLYSITHSYGFTGAFRYYIPLGASTRFGIFNELQLGLSGGQSKVSTGAGRELTGTYTRNFGMDVGLTPGLIMFLSNYSALEVNIGVLGFSYHNTRAVTDQIYMANMNSHAANFKINLFSITFGVAFYL